MFFFFLWHGPWILCSHLKDRFNSVGFKNAMNYENVYCKHVKWNSKLCCAYSSYRSAAMPIAVPRLDLYYYKSVY